MKLKKLILTGLALAMTIGITGCSRGNGEEETTEKPNQIRYITSYEKMADNSFYIQHGKEEDAKYLIPYFGNTSFGADNYRTSSTSNNRIAWFMDDWSRIPTLYRQQGDKILHHAEKTLVSETFTFERFEYMGYTIGISGMTKTSSGRYMFNASHDEENGNTFINPSSDAARLFNLNAVNIMMDKIGNGEHMQALRSINISRAGTIRGLEKDKVYAAELYIGTEPTQYLLKADSILTCSMEVFSINTYHFDKDQHTIELELPEEMQDGYYSINGSGIFRFVNGDTYSEKTDFNIPNPSTVNKFETDEGGTEAQIGNDTGKTIQIPIKEKGKYIINIKYNTDTSYSVLPDPTARLITNTGIYTISHVDPGQFESAQIELEAGNYTVEINGLYDRAVIDCNLTLIRDE